MSRYLGGSFPLQWLSAAPLSQSSLSGDTHAMRDANTELSIPEMLNVIDINKRFAAIEQILRDHAKTLDAIYALHGQRKDHRDKTRQALKK
jgi:hypothetical protein